MASLLVFPLIVVGLACNSPSPPSASSPTTAEAEASSGGGVSEECVRAIACCKTTNPPEGPEACVKTYAHLDRKVCLKSIEMYCPTREQLAEASGGLPPRPWPHAVKRCWPDDEYDRRNAADKERSNQPSAQHKWRPFEYVLEERGGVEHWIPTPGRWEIVPRDARWHYAFCNSRGIHQKGYWSRDQ